MISVEKQIEEQIHQAKGGSVFFPTDFGNIGSIEAVKVVLHRLAKRGLIKRLSFGIYAKPIVSRLVCDVYPSAEEIARTIARRDNARLLPTGAYARHVLGLSTQVLGRC
jgi:hypothetical protein